MNSINHAINGLASSLFLNVGLTRVAEKFDPVVLKNSTMIATVQNAANCEMCNWPCNFTVKTGQ